MDLDSALLNLEVEFEGKNSWCCNINTMSFWIFLLKIQT